MKRKTAILLGATGLTGGILLQKLLEDERYEKVKIFTRKPIQIESAKIEENLIDLFELNLFSDLFKADEVFCCIGSTQSKTPDNEVYRKVDFGIPATAAKLSKKNSINTFIVISALGADEKSRFFYNKTKGEMEGAVLEQQIPNTYILQPSLISGNRSEKRPFEYFWKKVMKIGDYFLIGKLKKYRSIHPETIAEAMLLLANTNHPQKCIISDDIKDLVSYSNRTND